MQQCEYVHVHSVSTRVPALIDAEQSCSVSNLVILHSLTWTVIVCVSVCVYLYSYLCEYQFEFSDFRTDFQMVLRVRLELDQDKG